MNKTMQSRDLGLINGQIRVGISISRWFDPFDLEVVIYRYAVYSQLVVIGFGFFLVIPILLLLIGFRIWYVRKKR